MVYLAVGIALNVVLLAMFITAIRLLREPSPKALARREKRRSKKAAKRQAKAEKAGITLEEPPKIREVLPSEPEISSTHLVEQEPEPAAMVVDLRGGQETQPMLANTIVVQSTQAQPAPEVTPEPNETTKRRFVPGGPPMEDGTIPDFSLSVSHLFVRDNGVQSSTRRRSTIDPIKLSIQAGARPVTPLLERVVQAMVDIGLEPAQTRPLVHSFMDKAGRSARVRLGYSSALGDLIEIEIEPSLSPAAMASVMQLLAELDFDPNDASSVGRSSKG